MTITNYTVQSTPRFSIFSEDQKETLFNALLTVLSRTGADVHHEGARELFARHGCSANGLRVRIPPHLVQQALASAPRSTTVYSWDGTHQITIEQGRSYFGPGPTPPNFIDPDTLKRRPYLRKDATTVARVCDALPNIGYVQSLGSISDVTSELADVYEFADMIRNTTKIVMNWAFCRDNVESMHQIGIAMAGGEELFRRRPNFVFYGEPISPLVSGFHAIDKCMYCAEHRIPQVYTPCCIGGATVPATHAGQILVALSEALVGVVAAQLISPGTCVVVGGVQSILDMRRSIYSYGAPELGLMSAALTEMAHYCGLPMFSTSGCTDTKKLELQSGVEAALSIHAAMLSGAEFVHDNGYTESGITGDVFQLVLDDEIIGMARCIERGIEVTPETMAVDVIGAVGPGGHYLEQDHTLEHFRSHWRPTMMERGAHEDWEGRGRPTMRDRIIDKTRDIIEHYEGPIGQVPAEANEQIEAILAAAEKRVAAEAGSS